MVINEESEQEKNLVQRPQGSLSLETGEELPSCNQATNQAYW